MESQESTPLQQATAEASFNFNSEGGQLVTIRPDGTVILHKEGADKQAAQAFWGAMGEELKKIESTLIAERDQWKGQYEELKTAISAIIDMMAKPQPPALVMPGSGGPVPPMPTMPPTRDLNQLMREGGPLKFQAGGSHKVIMFDPTKIDTGFYKEADGSTHIVYKGKKLF